LKIENINRKRSGAVKKIAPAHTGDGNKKKQLVSHIVMRISGCLVFVIVKTWVIDFQVQVDCKAQNYGAILIFTALI
jgi:hypothetical protein